MHVQADNPLLTPEQADAKDRDALDWVVGDARGRRVLRAVLRWAGIEETGATEGIERMAFDAGRRMVGGMLRAQLRKHAPEGWVAMEAEHVQELALQVAHEAREEERKRAAQGTPAPTEDPFR
ncbi:MAG: hypothetical protein RJA36_812 [Pseudomonadota bacterium]